MQRKRICIIFVFCTGSGSLLARSVSEPLLIAVEWQKSIHKIPNLLLTKQSLGSYIHCKASIYSAAPTEKQSVCGVLKLDIHGGEGRERVMGGGGGKWEERVRV